MNKIIHSTQQIRNLLAPVIGETKAKTYFSYYGIFKNGLMFALYKEQKFYLRLSTENIREALSYEGVEQLNDPSFSHSDKFFLIPNTILNELPQYAIWFENSLKEVQANKYQSYYKRKDTIRSLPNMTFRLEKYLKRINIRTIEALRTKGEINTFVELIKIGIEANHITLFKLYGAIHHQFIYTISPEIKRALLHDANEALYAAGLRRRFTAFDVEIL